VPNGRPWTKHQLTILKRDYYTHGPKQMAERLKRSVNSIRAKAHTLGLGDGCPKGYVRLAEVDPKATCSSAHPRAVQLARTAKVLDTIKGRGGNVYIVPTWWADAYAEQLAAATDTAHATRAWMTGPQIAAELGVHPDTITTLLKRRVGIGRHLANVRRVKLYTPRQQWRYHPSDAREAIRRIKARQ